MANRDGTGPSGMGPLTGRELGHCRRGSRGGFGMRFRQPVTLSKEEEKKILEAGIKDIEEEKKEIKKRLKEVK